MPRPQRSLKEVQAVRDEILDAALDMIVDDGFDALSMRKLGARLGIAAKTLYNYFTNKDELYLCILMRGFEQLQLCTAEAINLHGDPWDRVDAALRAFITFGLDNPFLYDLMFTWRVPRYEDYVDTPVEPVARRELDIAMGNEAMFMVLLQTCVPNDAEVPEPALRFEMIQAWSHAHGYVAGVNNRLLNHMHDDPASLREAMTSRVCHQLRRALTDLITLHGDSRSDLLALHR